MKELTNFETDALNELFNIGLHRAAASLSELTTQRVIVDLPRLWVCPVAELQERLVGLVEGELATVHQVFRGEFSGDAVFLLEYDKATALAGLLTEGAVATGGVLDQSAREVLAEVGNIVLGACLGAFGNVLKVAVSFSVPRIHIESLQGMLRSMLVEEVDDVHYALLAATHFKLSEQDVGGYLVIVLGVTSIARASKALEDGMVL
jgi:chemotaxis protein CheC